MKELDLTVTGDEQAAFAPARDGGDKLVRAGQLDIDVQLVFQDLQGFEQSRRLGFRFNVHIDGGRSPAMQQRGGYLVVTVFIGCESRRGNRQPEGEPDQQSERNRPDGNGDSIRR